jgi:ribose transport system substrate-binding protein
MEDREKRDEYFVDAVARTLDVLESFDTPEEELSIMEVARRVDINYASAYRFLYTLAKRGYVSRRDGSQKYARTSTSKRYRVGYAELDGHNGFSSEVTRSMVLAARAHDVDLVVKDNEGNPAKALANAEVLLDAGVRLLIEYQMNDVVAHRIAAKCQKAALPLIAITFAHPGAYYFGGDHYLAGSIAGEYLCEYSTSKWCGRADKLLVLLENSMTSVQGVRMAGICDAVTKGMPWLQPQDIEVAPSGTESHDGYRATKAFLERFGAGTKVLIGALSDPLAVGACRAALKCGASSNVAIVGQGAGRDARILIRRGGPFKASVAYFPHTYGERVVPLALKILSGEQVRLTTYADTLLLTEANMNEYYHHTSRGKEETLTTTDTPSEAPLRTARRVDAARVEMR